MADLEITVGADGLVRAGPMPVIPTAWDMIPMPATSPQPRLRPSRWGADREFVRHLQRMRSQPWLLERMARIRLYEALITMRYRIFEDGRIDDRKVLTW